MLIGEVVEGDADVVFGFEAILDDVELEATDGAQDGVAFHAFEIVEDLDGAFLGEFVETFFELFSLEGVAEDDADEVFGAESWDALVGDGFSCEEGVADMELSGVPEPDDVAGVGFLDVASFLGHEHEGFGEGEFGAGAAEDGLHTAFKPAGAESEEGDAVAVSRVHVCLDFEDEP